MRFTVEIKNKELKINNQGVCFLIFNSLFLIYFNRNETASCTTRRPLIPTQSERSYRAK